MVIAQGQQMLASDILNLTFFPKGAVLAYSSAAWNGASAEFKKIWHICDGTKVGNYTTLNLVDKFIRGGTSSGTIDGSDTVVIPVPQHTHGITQTAHNHTQEPHTHEQDEHTHIQDKHGHDLEFSAERRDGSAGDGALNDGLGGSVTKTKEIVATNQNTTAKNQNFTAKNIAANATITINNTGTVNASIDNRPAFCTLIFIEKVV